MNTCSSLRIAAELKNLAEIRRFVEETASALGVDPAVIPGLLLAVDEAVSNIIAHGYQGRGGIVEIEVSREEDALVIRLCDEAPPFDPTNLPPPDLTLPLDQRPIGGLGIHLIRQVMDEMTYCVTPQGGNELTLVKRGVLGQGTKAPSHRGTELHTNNKQGGKT
ncbi:MAG: ATP-binding protein [Chloroflexi bacterium]|nr:ATP-binding protein [Chloroflexota bacterium]